MSQELNAGDSAPDFTLPGSGGQDITLSEYRGKNVILYFYPKDDTPGCTKQACAFRNDMAALEALDAVVIGISKDTPAKHDKFIHKYELNFPLASDEDGVVCDAYGVWKEKSMYGKTFMGIERTTFLIDKDGKIAALWRKVKVPGHAGDVRSALKEL